MICSLVMAVAFLRVSDAVAHPTTDTAVVYLKITNTGPRDVLDGAQTSVARSVTLHKSMPMQGMSGMSGEMMVPVSMLNVPEHGSLVLSVGGAHLMVESLEHPLQSGTSFVLRLHFQHAGWVDVRVRVEPY